MADDVKIIISGDNKDLKKAIVTTTRLLKRFEKANSASTARRVTREKSASEAIRRGEERKNKRIESMDRRLSRRRARNRLKQMRDNIRIAKREAREEERIKKKSSDRMRRLTKVGMIGAAGVGIGVGVSAIRTLKNISVYEIGLRRLSLAAHLSQVAEMGLNEAINKTSLATGASRTELLDLFTVIQDESGRLDLAMNSIDKLGKLIRIVPEGGAEGISRTYAALANNLGNTGQDLIKFLEITTVVGQKGNLTLDMFADNGKALVTAFQATGDISLKAWGRFNAVVQTVSKSTKSAEQTTTIMNNLIGRLRVPTVAMEKGFKEAGIPLKKANGEMADLYDTLLKVDTYVKKGGSLRNLGFSEQELILALTKMGDNTEELKKLAIVGETPADEIERQMKGIETTMDQTMKILGSLVEVLSERAFKDFFTELSNGLMKFLENKDELDKMVEKVKELGDALGVVAKGIVAVGNFFGAKDRNKERYDKFHALSMGQRRKLIRDYRGDREGQAEAVNNIFIENNWELDPVTLKIRKKESKVINQNNNNKGNSFVYNKFNLNIGGNKQRSEFVTAPK